MTEPVIPTSEEFEAGLLQKRQPVSSAATEVPIASDADAERLHAFELTSSDRLDRRSRRR